MNLLLSMPGGTEWIMLITIGGLFIVFPVLAIMYYMRNRELKRKLDEVTKERDELIRNLIV